MKYTRYTLILIVFTILILAFIAVVNFNVDPQRIYSSTNTNNSSVLKDFAGKLETSEFGIVLKSLDLNERDRKKALAIYSSNHDCMIIGSSHIMQIGSHANKNSLPNYCSSITNLGVSGAVIEDYMAYTNMILERENKISTLIYGIDPWSFKQNIHEGWERQKNNVDEMLNKISIASKYESNNNYQLSLIWNLFNLEYFIKSISIFFELDYKKTADALREIPTKVVFRIPNGRIDLADMVENKAINPSEALELTFKNDSSFPLIRNLKIIKFHLNYFRESLQITIDKSHSGRGFQGRFDPKIEYKKQNYIFANQFIPDIGYEGSDVLLPDGSLAYPKKYTNESFDRIKKFNGVIANKHFIGLKEAPYDSNAVNLFSKLITYLQQNNINVVFVLSPYNNKAWMHKEQIAILNMIAVEQEIHDLAKVLKIDVLGSFNPIKLNCFENEFYDQDHPTYSCISKIENNILKF